ncbi:MAG: rhodanese-like domain-containing protein [Rhodobacteraceae bacterium]|nr:rhodanese-like domain-containing protein [Paracoccaceae bacterium]MCB1368737.1 rhodanese-like domain-containing protein [Paracoccaceae bacterium]
MVADDNTFVTEVLPHEAWESLKTEPNSVLVDVRTKAEWSYVGCPNLDSIDRELIRVEWLAFPDMSVNPEFTGELFSHFGDRFPARIFFICRSGVRSLDAAEYVADILREIGRKAVCVNVEEGFEGDLDESRHRGNQNGWKQRGLPWRQT